MCTKNVVSEWIVMRQYVHRRCVLLSLAANKPIAATAQQKLPAVIKRRTEEIAEHHPTECNSILSRNEPSDNNVNCFLERMQLTDGIGMQRYERIIWHIRH